LGWRAKVEFYQQVQAAGLFGAFDVQRRGVSQPGALRESTPPAAVAATGCHRELKIPHIAALEYSPVGGGLRGCGSSINFRMR
jgi:hypothetical protein